MIYAPSFPVFYYQKDQSRISFPHSFLSTTILTQHKEETIMDRIETVKAFAAALEARDFEKSASYLSDDFVLSGPVPQPLG